MRALIAPTAFRHRGSAPAGFLIRQAFAHASRALPVRRVAESEHVLAFHHPVPGFTPVHVLLVPKLSVPTLMRLTDQQRDTIATEVEGLARDALDALGRTGSGFLIVVNGGRRQDVRQVHFHLVIDGYDLTSAPAGMTPGTWIDSPDPKHGIHQARAGDQPLLAGLVHAAEQHDSLGLEARGYSVVWDARTAPEAVHLTAGSGGGPTTSP